MFITADNKRIMPTVTLCAVSHKGDCDKTTTINYSFIQ